MGAGDYPQQQKEWFSRAFLAAVSAGAGYRLVWPQDDVDGVDGTVRDSGVTVDFQLKATGSPKFTDGSLLFDLDVPTYRKLSGVRTSPGYLLVVVIPADTADWMLHTTDKLELRHCGYWLDLTGMSATPNEATIRLKIPCKNTLTVAGLVDIMGRARQRAMASP